LVGLVLQSSHGNSIFLHGWGPKIAPPQFFSAQLLSPKIGLLFLLQSVEPKIGPELLEVLMVRVFENIELFETVRGRTLRKILFFDTL